MEQAPIFINYLDCPVVHKEKFAQEVGVTVDTVNGWIDQGYLPTFCIGRHRLINKLRLTVECLENLPR